MLPQRKPFHVSLPLLSLLIVLSLTPVFATKMTATEPMTTPEPMTTDEPEPTPDISICLRKGYYRRSLGCICYMRYLGFLLPFDNGKRKEIYCTGGFDLPLPETRKFCRAFIKDGVLRPRRALKGLDRFAFNCAEGASILPELPEDSKFRSLFE